MSGGKFQSVRGATLLCRARLCGLTAPAIKAMACSVSLNVCLPAANRMMVLGMTILAVAMVLITE